MSLFNRRYKRLVPEEQRELIRRHRLRKPNWYVGSAEGSFSSVLRERRPVRDPALLAEIEKVKADLDAHRARKNAAPPASRTDPEEGT